MKPGYKQTEVGVIPEEWESVKAGDIGRFRGGNGFPLRFQGETASGYPFYKVSDMNNEGNDTFMFDSNNWISEGSRKQLGATAFPSDSIIFAKVGAAVFLERKKILTKPSCIDNNLCALVLDKSRTHVRFVHYSLLNIKFGALVSTTALPSLSGTVLSQISFALPPLPEQRAIATALSDVDGLLGALDRLIAKKRDLKQAAMQQLLTGQTRLPGFKGEWVVKRLGEVGIISGSGVDKKLRPDETPVRLVNYMDAYRKNFISSKDLDHWVTAPPHQLRRCAVQKGDVFFTPSSETRNDIANSAVAMEDIPDAAYSYHIVRLRLTEPWDLLFRAYAFKTKAFFNQAETICDGGGTRYVISQGKFRTMTVLVPPLPEQTAIASTLSEMDAELAGLEQRREKTRALKQGMMQELLTGRTRLV